MSERVRPGWHHCPLCMPPPLPRPVDPRSSAAVTKTSGAVRPLATSYLLVGSVEWSVAVALAAAVYDRTHSTGWISALVVARFFPSVVVGPLAGVLADRVDRRRVLVWSCALRIGPLVALTAAAAAGSPPLPLV